MNRLIDDLDRACPGYVPSELVEGLQYSWITGFVRHVIAQHVAGRRDAVQSAFDVIEAEIAGKFMPHRELAIVGFLEDMQNGNLHPSGSQPAEYRAYLGPHSLKSWDALNGFWGAVEHSKAKPQG